jgi:tRNA uridine 5-carbamoylmethylation protein Kti12
MNQNTLIVMRGIPGSGKSTLANSVKETYEAAGFKVFLFSTDDYFMKEGVYKFNPSQIQTAHLWNQKRAMLALIEGHVSPNSHCIVIDNTCTQAWEARDYVTPAHLLQYDISIMQPVTEWAFDAEECAKRNVHGVPLESIKAMLSRWEKDLTVEGILVSKSPWEK